MLHPVHAKIHQSVASDWTRQGPLTGVLPCGLMLRFLSDTITTTVSWNMIGDDRFRSLLSTTAANLQDFASALAWLQQTMNYDGVSLLYRRLQAALIAQDLFGTWRVVVDQGKIFVESIDPGYPEPFFEGELSKALQHDLRALESAWIPPFSDQVRCYQGEWTCGLPTSSHARLELLSPSKDS